MDEDDYAVLADRPRVVPASPAGGQGFLFLLLTDTPPFDGGGERPAMPTEGMPQPAGPGNPS
jgi:hypothetical protein